MDSYRFLIPQMIYYGLGTLEGACDKLAKIGNKPLVITDKIMTDIGYADRVVNYMKKQKLEISLFNEVNTEPTDYYVEKGTNLFKENYCDFVIALGGGSPIDTAKAISLMVSNPGEIQDYMGLGKVKQNGPPIVAIPTTSGTGSEVTQFTIITDTKKDVKMLIGSEYLIPKIAINDPALTMSVPPNITAATGIDALTHAIEAYTSRRHQPLADNFALSSIKRISKYLRRAWANGDDEEARSEMMLAAMEAGMAFNNSSVTIVHGMSRPLGALFHIPHGISNAVLLPACLEYAIMGLPERFANIAKAMGVKDSNLSDLDFAKEGLILIKKLCEDVEIPSISGLGIDKNTFMKRLDKMATDALASGSPYNTARKPSKEDIIKIYEKSF
ncbi:MAG: iron-containing alcohol dehydrogenase [Atribacterota bacterium]|jgi:1,3-propanediol dehydrogenase|nr:iron-containing alcohol dehydrogenase [Atribacterota bacterium]MDD5636669.1 iron-containing alcohol dehydrogenase [Atribacterota bacterium]